MIKLIITEKKFSKRYLRKILKGNCNKKNTITYERGQIYVFFENKDLEHKHVLAIAKALKMQIISESDVRAVIGY